MKPTSLFLLLAFALCASLPAFGSSVLAVSLELLSTRSELIFEGEVINTQSSFDADQTKIHTYVTFRITDIVGGSYAGTEITLPFLGGTVGGIGLQVADSTIPKLGETGIYFVEAVNRFQVNPFYGVDQGHFLVIESNGQRITTTRSRKMITGFLVAEDGTSVDKLSNGVALGLSVDANGNLPSGVTVLQFKQKILEYRNENQ